MLLTIWIRDTYPDTPYRVDVAADIPLSPRNKGRVKALHGKWSRGYPDLLILERTKKFGALFVELKVDGVVPNTEHTRRQAAYHEVLRSKGYKVEFCCGLEAAKRTISKYMRKIK